MRQHLFIHCSLEMTEFRQKLVRQPELHQPPWSLLLVPRMTPQANGEERHDLEPTMPREEYHLPHLAGGVSSQRMPSLALPEPGSHGGGMQEKWLQELLLPRQWNADLGLPTGWDLPAFFQEERTCPRGNGRKAVLPSYTLMPSCHILGEGIQQYFFT